MNTPPPAVPAPASPAALLPCPFCGNPKPSLICLGEFGEPKRDDDYYVACEKCRAQMCIGPGDRATAVADWNARQSWETERAVWQAQWDRAMLEIRKLGGYDLMCAVMSAALAGQDKPRQANADTIAMILQEAGIPIPDLSHLAVKIAETFDPCPPDERAALLRRIAEVAILSRDSGEAVKRCATQLRDRMNISNVFRTECAELLEDIDSRRAWIQAAHESAEESVKALSASVARLTEDNKRLRTALEEADGLVEALNNRGGLGEIHAAMQGFLLRAREALRFSPTGGPAEERTHGLDITREQGGIGLFESGGLYNISSKAPADGAEEH